MSYGYEVQIPPINTLAYFNAIANDGKMIQPIFTKEIKKEGKTIKRFTSETIRPSICSSETLKIIREMLVNVVEEGTGKPFRSEAVPFAGKTGTAQIATAGGYSSSMHNLSFCGYFPAERPQYSCIVVIRRPRYGEPSGVVPGSVFKTIAEKVHSHQTQIDLRAMRSDSTRVVIPSVKNGDTKALRNVLDELKIKNNTRQIRSEYARIERRQANGQVELQEMAIQEGRVPNVMGMGAKDAVYALEKSGLRVSFTGKGQVISQSVSPGQHAVKGQTVTIVLR
jgi:cell division protein FtsI (penicillin-binding protein 3)